MVAKPSGTLNIGQKELGPYQGNPMIIGNPQIFLNSAIPITETLGMYNFDNGRVGPMLAESWDVSPDGQVWTYHIRRGVQFHKGFGEMTVEDVVFSFRQVADSSKHARSANVAEMFFADDGSQSTPDDYTWVVDSGVPFSDIPIFELLGTPRAVAAWVVSKKQWDQEGEDEANFNTAATGPWELVEARTGEFWRMEAVENHWRQTPNFAELLFQEIPEESARVAGFQTGLLDTFVMALDSITEVEAVAGALLMQVPNAIQAGLNFYGQTYMPARDGGGEPWPNYNPDLPWVSSNSDTSSPEWDAARKVRFALSIAIDRQAIIDNLLLGFGHPLTLKDWMGPDEDRLPDAATTWPYDPDRARSLLAEAGFPNGFKATLTTAIRGAPSEVEACEAVAQYWDDIGIDVNFQNIPYGTYRPQAVARTYEGMSCHSVGARLAPTQGMASFLNKANFSWGSEHPFLEEKIPAAQKAVDREDREAIEDEIARWNIEHVFAETGLYVVDNVWPVGPKIAPWGDFVKQGDLRQINGYEYMTPR
ncbi:MAG: ABC transporter substrate-binding protein [Chloroflexi bacterium]|nr:ABC transporter substrate-binding protein [Chloroflexota bacterium]